MWRRFRGVVILGIVTKGHGVWRSIVKESAWLEDEERRGFRDELGVFWGSLVTGKATVISAVVGVVRLWERS